MISFTLIIFAVILLFLVLIAGGVVLFILNQRHKVDQAAVRNQEFLQRQQSAVWAGATVVSARGGVTGSEAGISQWARYELSLQVTPPGGQPYLARTNWLVDVAQMSMIQPGQQVSVRIDQHDTQVIYPGSNWAKYIPA